MGNISTIRKDSNSKLISLLGDTNDQKQCG